MCIKRRWWECMNLYSEWPWCDLLACRRSLFLACWNNIYYVNDQLWGCFVSFGYMYSKSSSVLYLQGTYRDEWCPLWCHCPPSLCWSSGPPLQWRWLSMCCHLFSSWKYWRQRWPQQRQMGHHTWRGARPPWWPLQGWGHSSTPLREGVSAETKMIEPPLWGFSSIKMSSCVLWCCMFVTFTFLLRRRVTGLPAVKIRFQVRPGHPALHPAVIIPTDTIHTINTWDTFCLFCCGTIIKTSRNWTRYDVITKTSSV